MNLLKLRLSMAGTIAVIIGISTLAFSILLSFMGALNLYSLIFLVALFNIAQWLFAPYLIKSLYGVRRFKDGENPELHGVVENLSSKSGIKTPQLMYSKMAIPNAFAYGSPLTGSHIAVTDGLLKELDGGELEAVIGHEIGHIKHRDVQVMMFISFLPSLFYMLSRSLLFSRYYSRDRRNSGTLALIGGVSMLVYFVLLLFNLNLSRLREYFADQHSTSVVEDGSRKLSTGLAKISSSTWRQQKGSRTKLAASGFKTLFISDPDRASKDVAELISARKGVFKDDMVQSFIARRITWFDRAAELFSTHPNIVKRLRALNY